jgi:hypothetical protein
MALREARYNPSKVANHSIISDKRRAEIGSDLTRAVNLTKLKAALDRMVERGMKPELAEAYLANADSLLQLIRSENNRLHDF